MCGLLAHIHVSMLLCQSVVMAATTVVESQDGTSSTKVNEMLKN